VKVKLEGIEDPKWTGANGGVREEQLKISSMAESDPGER